MKFLIRFDDYLNNDKHKNNYYIVYSIIFLLLISFIFSWYIVSNRSLIWCGDGWLQHYKAYIYWAKYLRKIIRELLANHRLIIPDWDYNIGEGSDIVNALHYYVIGDPLAFFAVLVPTRYMHYFYSFSCILRLFLAGVSFSALAFGTGRSNRYGILAGSFTYCFCLWALTNAARHIYFLNPMIYFPFMILGIEKIIKKESPYLFIAFTAVSAVSNFYFFYMIVILTIVYVMVRLYTYIHTYIQ